MVLTNYECWACSEKDNNTCDMVKQAKPMMQIDHFNPRAVIAFGITRKESHAQQHTSRECFSKVSQISSNGYYGFMHVKENDEHVLNKLLEVHGNLDENVGMSESSTSLTENITTFACNTTNSKQKRAFQEDNISNEMYKNIKRCRLEACTIIQDSCTIPLNESTVNMEIDDVELQKDTKSLTTAPSLHQLPVSCIHFSSDKKNYFQDSNANNFASDSCITTDIKNRNTNSKLPFEYNSTIKPELCAFYTEESGSSRTNKAVATKLDDGRNKNIENENKMFIERMFSETHGGGIYCLQNVTSAPDDHYDI